MLKIIKKLFEVLAFIVSFISELPFSIVKWFINYVKLVTRVIKLAFVLVKLLLLYTICLVCIMVLVYCFLMIHPAETYYIIKSVEQSALKFNILPTLDLFLTNTVEFVFKKIEYHTNDYVLKISQNLFKFLVNPDISQFSSGKFTANFFQSSSIFNFIQLQIKAIVFYSLNLFLILLRVIAFLLNLITFQYFDLDPIFVFWFFLYSTLIKSIVFTYKLLFKLVREFGVFECNSLREFLKNCSILFILTFVTFLTENTVFLFGLLIYATMNFLHELEISFFKMPFIFFMYNEKYGVERILMSKGLKEKVASSLLAYCLLIIYYIIFGYFFNVFTNAELYKIENTL